MSTSPHHNNTGPSHVPGHVAPANSPVLAENTTPIVLPPTHHPGHNIQQQPAIQAPFGHGSAAPVPTVAESHSQHAYPNHQQLAAQSTLVQLNYPSVAHPAQSVAQPAQPAAQPVAPPVVQPAIPPVPPVRLTAQPSQPGQPSRPRPHGRAAPYSLSNGPPKVTGV
ncbi:hypothetical protein FS749_016145 [Ceratobasidium sp. UAMH 11750]|nr:hypothetical protein FS749_016145 [Ceratobasidium sp. UAMH 11750]